MKLSIVIPVWNEAKTIEELIRRVLEATQGYERELVIVDDGSTDGTGELLENSIRHGEGCIKVMHHRQNRGKGAAIRTGLEHVSGDVVIIQDADLEYDPRDYPRLLDPIRQGQAEVVYGSRYYEMSPWAYLLKWLKSRVRQHPFEIKYLSHFLGIQCLNLLVRLLYGQRITDEATGYKVFKASVLKQLHLKANRFEFCPEVTAKVLKLGHPFVEIPISYAPRTGKEGKKLKWTDGFICIWTLIKYRFVH